MTNAECLKNHTNLAFKRISFEKESPQGDLKQETCRKHPVLLYQHAQVSMAEQRIQQLGAPAGQAGQARQAPRCQAPRVQAPRGPTGQAPRGQAPRGQAQGQAQGAGPEGNSCFDIPKLIMTFGGYPTLPASLYAIFVFFFVCMNRIR